ncbi:UNVERIFIED_ORG: hypothetical protein M2442_002679 [Methylorubrum zatmanii]|nr:hypothetical protein [Methylorubrum zatmanii]
MRRLYRFQIIQNDATALIVERQYAPGRRIDLTSYRVSASNPAP